jgi:hypothetical protein
MGAEEKTVMAKEPIKHVHHVMHTHDGGRVHGHSMDHTHGEDGRVYASHHDHKDDSSVKDEGEIHPQHHSPDIPGEGDESQYLASRMYPTMG